MWQIHKNDVRDPEQVLIGSLPPNSGTVHQSHDSQAWLVTSESGDIMVHVVTFGSNNMHIITIE